MIAPAPRNPIPVTIWAAIRVGSARMTLWPKVRNSLNPYAGTIVNSAEPTETSRCVRRPASRSRSSRSRPRTPPRAAARATRPSTSGQPSVGRLDASSSGFLLRFRDPLDPERSKLEQLVQPTARERLLLRGRLDLHEGPLAGHDDVHVDFGSRVLGIIEIEQRLAADDAHRDGRDRIAQRLREPEPVEREARRDVGTADRRAACTAVCLKHVAVEPERPLAERPEIRHRTERPADQALDLDRTPSLLASRGFALSALAGRGRQQRVLGGHPPASFAEQPARDALLDRGGAEDLRLALRVQHRPVRLLAAVWLKAEAGGVRREGGGR